MALKRDVYRALEDVVGSENISEEPAILDAFAWRGYGPSDGTSRFMPRFEAVILPKDTEQVQVIVRLCNRYKVQFKASGSGWGTSNFPAGPGVIQLDLRRMNRIIEINEKNMYAVVEPYVTGAQLQSELMKRGLNCTVTGAGSQTSALPLATFGFGFTSQTTSYGERNVLGVEWVTPDGEIIRLGSLGASGEWFCGDGPGPSLRGAIRGPHTPAGGMGVFTKAATKIYHWPGPATFPIEGVSPHYAPSQIPPGFMVRFLTFPSLIRMVEAQRMVGESEIALQAGHNLSLVVSSIATCNEEDIEILQRLRKLEQGPGFLIVIAGNSPREFEYKQRVLHQIMEATGGKSLEPIEDPRTGGALMWRCLRATSAIREALRATSTYFGGMLGHNFFALLTNFMQKGIKLKEELIKKGLALDDGQDLIAWPFEHGRLGRVEIIFRSFPRPEVMNGVENFGQELFQIALNEHLGMLGGGPGRPLNILGPHMSNYHLWLRKIKTAFDPNGVSESTKY
jgi:glycolate oxidase